VSARAGLLAALVVACTPDGEVPGDDVPAEVSGIEVVARIEASEPGGDQEHHPSAAWAADHWLVTWTRDVEDEGGRPYVEGVVLAPDRSLTAVPPFYGVKADAVGRGDEFLLAWEDPTNRVSSRRVGLDGTLFTAAELEPEGPVPTGSVEVAADDETLFGIWYQGYNASEEQPADTLPEASFRVVYQQGDTWPDDPVSTAFTTPVRGGSPPDALLHDGRPLAAVQLRYGDYDAELERYPERIELAAFDGPTPVATQVVADSDEGLASRPKLAARPDGTVAVAWRYGIEPSTWSYVQLYSPTLEPQGEPIEIAPGTLPDRPVILGRDEGWWVAWEHPLPERGSASGGRDVYLGILSPDGQSWRVEPVPAGDPGERRTRPHLVDGGDAGVLLTYESGEQHETHIATLLLRPYR